MSEETAVVVRDESLAQLPALLQEMSIEQVASRVNKVKELQKRLMTKGTHYGVIPGTPKPTLLKPGAELLCLTFMLDPQYTHEIKQDGQHREITSRCVLYHIPTNNRIASGEGSCSTYESKYAYRKTTSICPKCGKELRRSRDKDEWYCWTKMNGCGAVYPLKDPRIKAGGREANPDIPDQYNTVLKMANKRSLIAAILNATAASEIYTQDVEDFTEDDDGMVENEPRQPTLATPPPPPQQRAPLKVVPERSEPAAVAGKPPVAAGEPQPLKPPTINLLVSCFRGVDLIPKGTDDAMGAINWLITKLDVEPALDENKPSLENLRILLGGIRMTELETAQFVKEVRAYKPPVAEEGTEV